MRVPHHRRNMLLLPSFLTASVRCLCLLLFVFVVASVPAAADPTPAVAAPGVGGSEAPGTLAVAAPGSALRSDHGHAHREATGVCRWPAPLAGGCADRCASWPSALRASMPSFDLPLGGRWAGRLYAYDQVGRRTNRWLPGGQRERMSYTIGGLLTSRTDFNSHTTTFGYDANNRLTTKTPDAPTGSPTVR